MGKVYETINPRLREFMTRQKLFFVATAPSEGGHINVSPKGLPGTFAVVDDTTVAYLDLTGSGVETIAHVQDNGRICVMFCALDGPPLIVRIHGRGEVVTPDDDRFAELLKHFGPHRAVRSIIVVHATRISDSCGYGVPLYDFKGEREQLPKWAERKGPDGVEDYQQKNNVQSLDGLPGVARHE